MALPLEGTVTAWDPAPEGDLVEYGILLSAQNKTKQNKLTISGRKPIHGTWKSSFTSKNFTPQILPSFLWSCWAISYQCQVPAPSASLSLLILWDPSLDHSILNAWPRLSHTPSSYCLWSLCSALYFCPPFVVVTYPHICLSHLTLSLSGFVPVFFSCLLISRSTGRLVPWAGITDKQYLCSWGRCRWSPCQHECGRTRGSEEATFPGDRQTARWFEMFQERDHTHLLGRTYLSAKVKRSCLWFLLLSMARRKRVNKHSEQREEMKRGKTQWKQ